MGHADYYKSGTYNGICDRCGKKYKFTQLKLEWDGLYVCDYCWEPRQPQDYVKGVRDNMAVPVSRPQGGNLFIDDIIVTESPNISLNLLVARLKSLIVSVSSACSILSTKYPFVPASKVVNGATLNSTTLG